MKSRKLIIGFLIMALVLPIFVSVYAVIDEENSKNSTAWIFSEEEKEEKEKEKDHEKEFFVQMPSLFLSIQELNFSDVNISKAINAILDQPTPPPKVS